MSTDDPLAPPADAAGWSGLAPPEEPQRRPGDPPPPEPAAPLGAQTLGDPFMDLGEGMPDLELADVDDKLPLPSLPPPSGPGRVAGAPQYAAAGATAPHLDAGDEAEALTLADYGEPPASFVTWVPYALLVTARRSALKKAMASLARLEAVAVQDAEDAMCALGKALHAHADRGRLEPLAVLLQDCDEAEGVAAGRSEQWAQSREAAEAQRSSLTQKLEHAQRAALPYRDRETKLATQMETRASDLRRAEAKRSRVQIEIRNLRQAAERTEAPLDEAKLGLLDAELEAREADVATARGHVDELTPKLATARKELASMLSEANEIQKQRRAVDVAQDRTEKLHLSTTGDAEKAYRQATHALASAAVERDLAADLAPGPARTAALMTRTLESRGRELELHRLALRVYDKAAYQKGWALIVGVTVVVLVMLAVMVFR